MKASELAIPENWPVMIRRAIIHAATLAHYAICYTRSMAVDSDIQRVRLAGMLDQARQEIALLNEEIRILHTRVNKILPKHRPHYFPAERLSILIYKASRGWTIQQAALAFSLTETTISSWLHELEVNGDENLVRIPVPHNKYPACLGYLARKLKAVCPRFGKKSIAEYLLRAGIQVSDSSIGRYLRRKWYKQPPDLSDIYDPHAPTSIEKKVTSKYPGHIWITDLTVVPTSSGFWSSILPYTIRQCWPFCWWVMIIIDHYSRKVIAFALFKKMPTSKDVTNTLDKANKAHKKPKHIITDKGKQFDCQNYQEWCKKNNIKYRYGAVGKYGSIAIIERFIRTMKDECLRILPVPLELDCMRQELASYLNWYNQHRPHLYLKARTPQEVYLGSGSSIAPPKAKHVDPLAINDIRIDISYHDGKKHLPLIKMVVDKAA